MISFLNGILVEKQPAFILLDVNGVGYEVFISLNTYDTLPPAGQPCRILTHDHLREDVHLLFGFSTEDERALFRTLQNVSGIGAKTALCVLNGMSLRELKIAIVEKNVKALSRISGIGKKTAERIVLELAEKIDPLEALSTAAPEGKPSMTSAMRDAVLALCALGHPQDTALALVQKVAATAPDADTETLIKRALAAR